MTFRVVGIGVAIWLAHNFPLMPTGTRLEPIDYNGEPIVLVLATHERRDVWLSVMRLEAIDDRIWQIRSYAFSSETSDDVAKTLGLLRGPATYSFRDLAGKSEVV